MRFQYLFLIIDNYNNFIDFSFSKIFDSIKKFLFILFRNIILIIIDYNKNSIKIYEIYIYFFLFCYCYRIKNNFIRYLKIDI